jgi:pimeloyl-ACP methyl ester carboxylesterase
VAGSAGKGGLKRAVFVLVSLVVLGYAGVCAGLYTIQRSLLYFPPSRLVLIAPYDSIVELAAQAYPLLPVRWLVLDPYESGKFAPGIRVPTTIIEAGNDEVIPHASTEKLLHRFAPGVATMTVIDGVGHNDLETNSKYRATLQGALR